MTIRWGVSPIGWANDDLPALGAGATLDTILSDARAIGFEGVELGRLFPRDPVVLAPVMAAHGLALIGGWYGMTLLAREAEAEIAAMTQHLDLLAAMGAGVGLTLDTGHAVLGGIDPVAVVRDWPGRIAHVHAKDIRADRHAATMRAGGSFLDGVIAGMFTTPGDGDHDHAPVAALRAIGYAGWIVIEVEQDPAVADLRRHAATGLATLRRLMATAA